MGFPISEVLTWDVEDIFKLLALQEREEDATGAYQTYILAEADRKNTKP